MSDEAQTEDEPSIEEILDSIRQIINEDDDDDDAVPESTDTADAEDAPSEAPLDQSAIDDMDFDAPTEEPEEPLDQSAIDDIDFDAPSGESDEDSVDEPLDQSAIDDIDFDAPTEGAESASEEDDDVLDLTELVEGPSQDIDVDLVGGDDTEPEAEEAPEDVEATAEPEPLDQKDDDVSDANILTEKAESAAVLAMKELVRKTAVEHNGITLEDIVRSELKPLLTDWLDQHLPTVIERLVQDELERVSKRVLED